MSVLRDVAIQLHEATKESDNPVLAEAFDKVRAMLAREDRGWSPLFKNDDQNGLTLQDLHEWSHKLRESTIGAPWLGRGLRLRYAQVWRDGIRYGNIPDAPEDGRGRPGRVAKALRAYKDKHNERSFFAPSARRRREGCLYHDGLVMWIGEESTKRLTEIPFDEITGQLRDPNNKSVIWAYRRAWMRRDPRTGKSKEMVRWYFDEQYVDKRVKTITWGDPQKPEEVDQQHVAFVQHANSMNGNSYGSPDALAAYVWNSIARDLYMDGVTVSQALATLIFTAQTKQKDGASSFGVKYATADGPGSAVSMGAADSLAPLATAGKAYAFRELNAVTAVIATALDVSNIALTSDVANAGSSYGSAQTLDLPTRLTMEIRRDEHVEMDTRVLRWMGFDDPQVYFVSLDDKTEIYREVQALLLAWSSGMYEPEPLEKRISEMLQVIGNEVPEGVLLPNNRESWERNDIDPAQDPSTANQTSSVGKPNATPPGQGQNSGLGKGQNANDIRQEHFIDMLRAFIAEMDADKRN